MFPVCINTTKENIGFRDFVENFHSICAEHHRNRRASAFAFIIYDFHKPHLTKLLMDTDYWKSLDKASGHFLTVFSLFEQPTKHKLNETLVPKQIRLKFEAIKINTPADVEASYREIIELFFGSADFPSPSVLFFQVDKERIIDHFFVELKEDKIEEGFNELKELLDKSIEAIAKITPENKKNYREIFEMIELNVSSATWWKKTKHATGKVINLVNFLAIFK